LRKIIIIFIIICSGKLFGQRQYTYDIFPKKLNYSADTLKEIFVYAATPRNRIEYDYDTIIHLDKSKFKDFINDFNDNMIIAHNKKHDSFLNRKQEKTYYELVFISHTNNKYSFYFKNNIVGVLVLWADKAPIMYSENGQISLYYKLMTKNILDKYKLTIDK